MNLFWASQLLTGHLFSQTADYNAWLCCSAQATRCRERANQAKNQAPMHCKRPENKLLMRKHTAENKFQGNRELEACP